MSLSDLCIRRPVFATMLVMSLVVLGLFSYQELGVDLFPRVDLPTVVVTTTFAGAGPAEVETQITKIIEEAVNTIEGIDELRSTSFEGLSQVVIAFHISRDGDSAAQDVRDRISRVLSRLPQGTDSPVIEKFDPDASPVLTVVVSADMPQVELTEFTRRRIKEVLESVSGVGQISMVGSREREVHISVDPYRLKSMGLDVLDVTRAVSRQNIEVPGGTVQGSETDFMLRTVGRIESVGDFAQVVVRQDGSRLIRIQDIAEVADAQAEEKTLSRLNGQSAVSLVIRKQSGTNTVAVIEKIKARVKDLKVELGDKVWLETVRDQSQFILASFHAVMEHLILGGLLASLVVFIFLGDVRSTLITAVAIPTSVISSFTLMLICGFSLNQMTLLALTLAVGLVIDDAIVVLENVYRHLTTQQVSARRAASQGTAEITLAVLATTFALVVIFVPVAFMPGIVGKFFQSFGLTMAFSILVSLLISLTLIPTLCARFLKPHVATGFIHRMVDALDRVTTDIYLRLLASSMRHRGLMVTLGILCVLATIPIASLLPGDFIPKDDQSEYIVNLRAAEGTPLQATASLLTQIEQELSQWPEVKLLLTTVGEGTGSLANEGQIYVGLTDLASRQLNQFQIMDKTRSFLAKTFPELFTSVSIVPLISGGGQKQVDVNLSLQGNDLAGMTQVATQLMEKLQGTPGLVDLEMSVKPGKPEIRVKVDRTRAASLGVDLSDLAQTLRILVGGDEVDITRYKDPVREEEYEVRLRVKSEFRKNIEGIKNLFIRAGHGWLPLYSFADVILEEGPTQIDRYARQRQVSFFANLNGIALGEAQSIIEHHLKEIKLPAGTSYAFLGHGKLMAEQQAGFLTAFLLSAIFVYLILGAQFESFIHPVTILVSLPLCIPFGLLSLLIGNESMNLYSTLGLFMLFGIVKKNSILQVDYANHLVLNGMDRLSATMEANRTRLRPILMTTVTLIAGMLPMAFGDGPGSGSRRGMATVIIGGQTLSLLITLLITPVVWSLFEDMRDKFFLRHNQEQSVKPHPFGDIEESATT